MFQVRICEFLENLEETVIVTLPEDPVYSSELIKVNLERIHLLGNIILQSYLHHDFISIVFIF